MAKLTLKEYEEAYNEMARVWNSLPGKKLVWPKDRFIFKPPKSK